VDISAAMMQFLSKQETMSQNSVLINGTNADSSPQVGLAPEVRHQDVSSWVLNT